MTEGIANSVGFSPDGTLLASGNAIGGPRRCGCRGTSPDLAYEPPCGG